MISELENMDVMTVRSPEKPSYDTLIDQKSNSRENEISGFAGNGHNNTEVESGNELNRLSGELNQRITQERNGLMN